MLKNWKLETNKYNATKARAAVMQEKFRMVELNYKPTCIK